MGYFFKANRIVEWCNQKVLEKTNVMHFKTGFLGPYWKLVYIYITCFKSKDSNQNWEITF